MPELPEVHTISSDLKKTIVGHKITNVVIEPGYRTFPDNGTLIKTVLNKTVVDVGRIAKNIIIYLEEDYVLIFHLAMSGRILISEEAYEAKWTRISMFLDDGSATKHLKFTDMRKFGKAQLIKKEELLKLKSKYGPDAELDKLNIKEFITSLKKKNTTIKNFLMDQKNIAGLGNIYTTDALFLSKIHPETKTKDINEHEAKILLDNIKKVILEGIKHRGATMKDKLYVDIFGKSGTQQEHFKIYMTKNCPNCGTKTEYKKVNGRGTYFCPNCQKIK